MGAEIKPTTSTCNNPKPLFHFFGFSEDICAILTTANRPSQALTNRSSHTLPNPSFTNQPPTQVGNIILQIAQLLLLTNLLTLQGT